MHVDARVIAAPLQELVAAASASPRMTEAARVASARHVPSFGNLSTTEVERLRAASAEAIAQHDLMLVHGTKSPHAASILDEGFTWRRLRDADGFEPYEYELREWGALAPGERSEDFIFAGVRFEPRGSDVAARLEQGTRATQRMRGTGFGGAAMILDPQALTGATLVPGPLGAPYLGMRAGGIAQLPDVVAVRVAADHGAMLQREVDALRLMGEDPRGAISHAFHHRRALSQQLERPHHEVVDWMSTKVLRELSDGTSPIEAHVRLPHATVRHLDVVLPRARFQAADGTGSMTASHGDAVPEGAEHLSVEFLLERDHVRAIKDAAARHGVPTSGVEEQLSMHAALDASRVGGTTISDVAMLTESTEQMAVRAAAMRRQLRDAHDAAAEAAG